MFVPAVAVLGCYRLRNRVRVLLLRAMRVLRLLMLLVLLLEGGPKRGDRQLEKGGTLFINHSLVDAIGGKRVRAREEGGTGVLPLLRRRPVCLHGQVIPRGRVRYQTSRVRVEYSTVGMCLVNDAGEAVAVSDIGENKNLIQQPRIKAEIDRVLRLWCAMLLYYECCVVLWSGRELIHGRERPDFTCLTDSERARKEHQAFSEVVHACSSI